MSHDRISFIKISFACCQLWYMLSKTLAEEAAWNFAKENGIDMVTINPGLVIGPLLQPTVNTSVESILKLINGTFQLDLADMILSLSTIIAY